MGNHIQSLLSQWVLESSKHPREDWVLATVIDVRGSSYRKPGAMMLIGGRGQRLGLVSGGCLERDLLRQASRVMQTGLSEKVIYDSTSDSDIDWQLGLGCGGVVTVLLQPVTAENDFLHLPEVLEALDHHQVVRYCIDTKRLKNRALLSLAEPTQSLSLPEHLLVTLKPQKKLLVFGAGIDAIPLVKMAAVMDWQLVLVDHRVGYAEPENFPDAHRIIHVSTNQLVGDTRLEGADGAIIMTHNIELDAAALRLTESIPSLRYLGLLGPEHRKQKVLQAAGLSEAKLHRPLHGPMGLEIGGELPESIALSVLAQCHQCLELGEHLYRFTPEIGQDLAMA